VIGRTGPLLAAPLLALVLALAAPARALAGETFGVSVNRVFDDHIDEPPSHWDAALAAVRDSGIEVARTDAFWMWAEPAAPRNGVHTYDWRRLDAIAGALARHHLRWQPVLDYSALWAASDRSDYHSPPTSNADYAAYAGAFAARYGRGGSFWAAHPQLDPLPVQDYEVWNEPNGSWFWRPAPDAAVYADLYLRTRAAIHAADGQATAVVGGLWPHSAFLDAMYAARPELRGQVDALGLHPYAPSATGVIANVEAFRRALVALGDPDVPIEVTEIGWPTSGHGPATVLPENARAAALETVTDLLVRSDCGVSAVIPYTWVTPERDPKNIDDWFGIWHPGGSPTPSSDAYAGVVARWAADPVTPSARLPLCHPPDPGAGPLVAMAAVGLVADAVARTADLARRG
jgi:hypothetical protein